MLFVIPIIALAALLASPYICVVFKRRRMIKRLIRVATQAGYVIRPLHKFVCLSLNTSGRYDILIQNKTHAYPVKLWSTARRNSILVIERDGRFFETSRVADPIKTDKSAEYTVNGRARRVKPTVKNFRVSKGKTVEPLLLYYPCNKRAVADLGISHRRIAFGDKIFGKILCSPPMLEKMLTDNTISDEKMTVLKSK